MRHPLFLSAKTWLLHDKNRARFARVCRAFTEHPEQTGETYAQHLWFTLTMTVRLLTSGLILLIHGVFPFCMVRTASNQIEMIYRIMKTRIPKARRAEIDASAADDYCV